MFCFSSYLSAFSHAIEQMGLEPEPFRVLRARGVWERESQKTRVCCRFCRATKINAGNIREQHCLQFNPAEAILETGICIYSVYSTKGCESLSVGAELSKGGALTSGSVAGRDQDFSSRSVGTCSIDFPGGSTGRKDARVDQSRLLHELGTPLICTACLFLLPGAHPGLKPDLRDLGPTPLGCLWWAGTSELDVPTWWHLRFSSRPFGDPFLILGVNLSNTQDRS